MNQKYAVTFPSTLRDFFFYRKENEHDLFVAEGKRFPFRTTCIYVIYV